MKTYAVTIRATIWKTIRVKAKNEDEAYEETHGQFNPALDYTEERYEEETMSVEKVTP